MDKYEIIVEKWKSYSKHYARRKVVYKEMGSGLLFTEESTDLAKVFSKLFLFGKKRLDFLYAVHNGRVVAAANEYSNFLKWHPQLLAQNKH